MHPLITPLYRRIGHLSLSLFPSLSPRSFSRFSSSVSSAPLSPPSLVSSLHEFILASLGPHPSALPACLPDSVLQSHIHSIELFLSHSSNPLYPLSIYLSIPPPQRSQLSSSTLFRLISPILRLYLHGDFPSDSSSVPPFYDYVRLLVPESLLPELSHHIGEKWINACVAGDMQAFQRGRAYFHRLGYLDADPFFCESLGFGLIALTSNLIQRKLGQQIKLPLTAQLPDMRDWMDRIFKFRPNKVSKHKFVHKDWVRGSGSFTSISALDFSLEPLNNDLNTILWPEHFLRLRQQAIDSLPSARVPRSDFSFSTGFRLLPYFTCSEVEFPHLLAEIMWLLELLHSPACQSKRMKASFNSLLFYVSSIHFLFLLRGPIALNAAIVPKPNAAAASFPPPSFVTVSDLDSILSAHIQLLKIFDKQTFICWKLILFQLNSILHRLDAPPFQDARKAFYRLFCQLFDELTDWPFFFLHEAQKPIDLESLILLNDSHFLMKNPLDHRISYNLFRLFHQFRLSTESSHHVPLIADPIVSLLKLRGILIGQPTPSVVNPVYSKHLKEKQEKLQRNSQITNEPQNSSEAPEHQQREHSKGILPALDGLHLNYTIPLANPQFPSTELGWDQLDEAERELLRFYLTEKPIFVELEAMKEEKQSQAGQNRRKQWNLAIDETTESSDYFAPYAAFYESLLIAGGKTGDFTLILFIWWDYSAAIHHNRSSTLRSIHSIMYSHLFTALTHCPDISLVTFFQYLSASERSGFVYSRALRFRVAELILQPKWNLPVDSEVGLLVGAVLEREKERKREEIKASAGDSPAFADALWDRQLILPPPGSPGAAPTSHYLTPFELDQFRQIIQQLLTLYYQRVRSLCGSIVSSYFKTSGGDPFPVQFPLNRVDAAPFGKEMAIAAAQGEVNCASSDSRTNKEPLKWAGADAQIGSLQNDIYLSIAGQNPLRQFQFPRSSFSRSPIPDQFTRLKAALESPDLDIASLSMSEPAPVSGRMPNFCRNEDQTAFASSKMSSNSGDVDAWMDHSLDAGQRSQTNQSHSMSDEERDEKEFWSEFSSEWSKRIRSMASVNDWTYRESGSQWNNHMGDQRRDGQRKDIQTEEAAHESEQHEAAAELESAMPMEDLPEPRTREISNYQLPRSASRS